MPLDGTYLIAVRALNVVLIMARALDAKMFTRDMVSTKVAVKVIDNDTDTITVLCYVLPFETTDTAVALKYLKKMYEAESTTFLKIVSLEAEHKMYGCTIAEFLSVAHELDPETRKPLD